MTTTTEDVEALAIADQWKDVPPEAAFGGRARSLHILAKSLLRHREKYLHLLEQSKRMIPEESVVKDAARYRFLRDNPWFQIEYTGELTLDQHIDAEMENKP